MNSATSNTAVLVCLCFCLVKHKLWFVRKLFFKSFWNQGTEMFSRDGLLPSRQWELGRCISTGSSLWLICLLSGLSRRCIFSDLYLPSYPPLLISSVLSRCSFPSERQARLEAVREAFLAAYSSTVGLKSSAPSPSGAISGLLEQFARGVGLRGSNAIVWASWWDLGPSCLHQLIQHVCAKQSSLQF